MLAADLDRFPFAGRLDILKSINLKDLKDQARVPEGSATRARGFSSFREIICVQPTERLDLLRSLSRETLIIFINTERKHARSSPSKLARSEKIPKLLCTKLPRVCNFSFLS